MAQLPPPVTAVVGSHESIAAAAARIAQAAGRSVTCAIGAIRFGADPGTPVGIISADYRDGLQSLRDTGAT